MNKCTYAGVSSTLLAILVSLATIGCSTSSVSGGRILPRPENSYRVVIEKALAYAQANRQRYGVNDAKEELAFLSESVDRLGQRHVRMQQIYRRVPVWGHQLIVHFSKTDEPNGISGTYRPIDPITESEPILSEKDAEVNTLRVKTEGWKTVETKKYIYVGALRPSLVYLVTIEKESERLRVFIDAKDGSVLHEISEVQEAR